jgi:hypothetical protein
MKKLGVLLSCSLFALAACSPRVDIAESPDGASEDPSTSDDAPSQNGATCNYDGRTYAKGTTWKCSDGCNTCSCDVPPAITTTLLDCLGSSPGDDAGARDGGYSDASFFGDATQRQGTPDGGPPPDGGLPTADAACTPVTTGIMFACGTSECNSASEVCLNGGDDAQASCVGPAANCYCTQRWNCDCFLFESFPVIDGSAPKCTQVEDGGAFISY